MLAIVVLAGPLSAAAQDKTIRPPLGAKGEVALPQLHPELQQPGAYRTAGPAPPEPVRFTTGGPLARHWWIPGTAEQQHSMTLAIYNPNGVRVRGTVDCLDNVLTPTFSIGAGQDARVRQEFRGYWRTCHIRTNEPVSLAVFALVRHRDEVRTTNSGNVECDHIYNTAVEVLEAVPMPDRP